MKRPDWARVVICSAAVLAAAGCAKPAAQGAGDTTPAKVDAQGDSPAAPNGCKLKVTAEETTLLCFPQQFLIRLPSHGWSFVRPSESPTLKGQLSTEGGEFIISALPLAKPDNYQAEVLLEQRFRNAQASSASSGFALQEPVFRAGRRSGRMTMAYQISGPELEQAGARSEHVWTVVPAADGSLLLYHVSWTGPKGRWSDAVENTLASLVDHFYVVDDRGNELAAP